MGMDYRMTDPIIKILKGAAQLLNGETKIAVEYPYEGQPDHTIRVTPKDEEL